MAKGEPEVPHGTEHKPDAVARRKQARHKLFMMQFSGHRSGSAAARRRK